MPRVASAYFIASVLVTSVAAVAQDAHAGHDHAHGRGTRAIPAGWDELPVFDTAGLGEEGARLRFAILAEDGGFMPGRLTFVPEDGTPRAKLFPGVAAAPFALAVRRNLIYSLEGRGIVTVPPGRYTVWVSRGLEWSAVRREVTLEVERPATLLAQLRREVDTTGAICGDFHLHTLTYSGHGDADPRERIISLVGEGVEFAVATDHNHNTSYDPAIDALRAHGHLTAVTGNEVSVPIGHFNAFPLDPNRRPPPRTATDARKLFKLIREEKNEFGVVPVIQVNHPRWGSIDYFGRAGLDPVTAAGADEIWSYDFDTIEVLNENTGWGYYDASRPAGRQVGAGRHWALRDWFNLLDRGHRYAAVGNSDSHAVENVIAGYPRNYLPSPTDDPGRIDVRDVAAALRARCVFTTTGPYVDFTVGGAKPGGEVRAEGGRVEVAIRVQAASWVDCDRVKVVVNGDVHHLIPVPPARVPVRLEHEMTLELPADAWVALLVEGDDPLAPIVHDAKRPVLPLAVVNPVWVDVDGDGRCQPVAERMAALAAAVGPDETSRFTALAPSERALFLTALEERGAEVAAPFVRLGLTDAIARPARLAALRTAAALAAPALRDAVHRALRREAADAFEVGLALRAAVSIEPDALADLVAEVLEQRGPEPLRLHAQDLLARLPAQVVTSWQVAGWFDNPGPETLAEVAYAPETDPGLDRTYTGREGKVTWKLQETRDDGYLDLARQDEQGKNLTNGCIAYAQCQVWADQAKTVMFALGSDDGCRLWVGDQLVLEDRTRHAAAPWQHLGRLSLKAGWNRVLVKVENGNGGFGLYLRVIGEGVKVAAAR